MATTYTWSIVALDCKPTVGSYTDYVVTSHWPLFGDDGAGHTASVYGTASFAVDPSKHNYTPYADITESQAIEWTQDALGADTVIAYEENVATQIEQQIFPPIVTTPLPWNNSQASEAS